MKTLLQFYQEYKAKTQAYQLAINSLYFDLATIAPKKGKPYRNAMTAILQGEAFAYEVHEENLKRLQALYERSEDMVLKKEIHLLLKSLDQNRFLPKDFYITFKNAIGDSEEAWLQAKTKNDYTIFKPHLIRVIEMQKKALSYIPKTMSDYDYLLDQFQAGMNVETYDIFFQKIKTHLLPLIKRVQEQGITIDDTPLKQTFPISKQKEFTDILSAYLQIDREKCYITTSEHPFTSFMGPKEARFTTHYYEDDVMSSILSIIHEYGHALYILQVDPTYHGTAYKSCIGFAMHESQSRFLENHIGRHPAFWKSNFPQLKELFPKQLHDVTYDTFMQMLNVSKPSFIRVEADELTYPVHILIRYEIEKAIFNGTLDVNQLDTIWNDKYEQYLGIRPSCAATGILQDMHWSNSNFGYFPTYALGSAYAAQIYNTMKKDIDIDQILSTQAFDQIASWLKSHVQCFGASKTANEILIEVTGEPFNSDYYIEYLCQKYSELYHI